MDHKRDNETLSDSFYYSTTSYEGLLQQLEHLLLFGDGVCTVAGVSGGGRTTLMGVLYERLSSIEYRAKINLVDGDSAVSLFGDMAEAFGLNKSRGASPGELIAELRSFQQFLVNSSQVALVAIDDAHLLKDQDLFACVSLMQGDIPAGCGIRFVLVGDKALPGRIDQLGLVDVSVYDFDVPSISANEIDGFARVYAQRSGIHVDTAKLNKIWAASKGNPKSILAMLSNQTVLDQKNTSTSALTWHRIPLAHGVAVLVLIAVLVVVYIGSQRSGVSVGGGEGKEVLKSVDRTVTQLKSPFLEPRSKDDEALGASLSKSVDVLDEQAGSPAGTVEQEANETNLEFSETASRVHKEDQLLDENDARIDDSELESNAVVDSKNQDFGEPSSQVIGQASSSQQQNDVPNKGQFLLGDVRVLTEDESYLLSLSPDRYILQIAAASKKASLEPLFQNGLAGISFFLYRAMRGSSEMYILVAGPFDSRAQASAAISGFSDEIQAVGPWPKSLKSVQNEIDQMSQ